MPGASELAGTIGTWMAVLLAIVALAGVLPAYVLFRRSRTARGQALASVDDHDQDFVSHSFSLLGTRINQRVRVPDLRDPPSKQVFEGCQNINISKLRSCDSTTCWVNFAHLMQTMFPTIGSSAGDDGLLFEDNQSYLPVHYLWLVVLGVAHRYAHRKDYGLPLGTFPQEHTRRRDLDYHIAGRSGLILRRNTERKRSPVKLYFEAHHLDVIRTALTPDNIPLRTLVLRFLGYINLAPDTYIKPSELRYGDLYPSEPRNDFSKDTRIAKLISGHVLSGDRAILRDIGLEVNKTAFVYLQVTTVTLTTEFGFRANSGRLLPQDLLESGYFEVGDWRLNRHERKANIWMERREVQRTVMLYLTAEMSANSFLYHTSRDMIASRLLKNSDLASTLDMVKGTIDSLQLTDRTKLGLRRNIAAVSETNARISTWSRHAMQALYTLDQDLEAIGRSGSFMWRAISILYAYDTDFRRMLTHVSQGRNFVMRFQIEHNNVSFQASENLPGVAFDFHHVFDKTDLAFKLVDGDMPVNEAVLAALKGHVRAAMWKLCLSPAGLLDIYSNKTDAMCLLGANPAGNLLRPRRSRHLDPWSQESAISDEPRDAISDFPVSRGGDYGILPPGLTIAPQSPSNSSESLDCDKTDDHDGLLHIAAFEGDLRLLRLLLRMGATINSEGQRFGSALQAASYAGRLNVVKELMDNGADVNARGGRHRNAVGAALRRGHVEVVQLLLDNGAAFGDQFPTQGHSSGLAVPINVVEGVEAGASLDRHSEVQRTDPPIIANTESLSAEPGSIDTDLGDKGPHNIPSPSVDESSSLHHQGVTSTSGLTEDYELFSGEFLDARGEVCALRLLRCSSEAIRLEGRSSNSTKESLPDWTTFLTYSVAARDIDFFYIETGSIVSMARPKSGIFYFGSDHRLSLNRENLFVLPLRRREDASDFISQWRTLCCQEQLNRAGHATSIEPFTRSSQDID